MSQTNPLLKDSPMPQPSPHEPSMEKNPASIRRIIAGDQAQLAGESGLSGEAPRPDPNGEAFEPGSRAGAGPTLISNATDGSVGAAFNALLASRFVPHRDVVIGLTRPMLKTWLDDNLPGIVERLVSAEIERAALGDFTAIEAGLLGSARHESGENLSKSEELNGREEAEAAEPWRYEDTAEGSREAGPPFEEIRSRRPLYGMAAVIVAGLAGIGASFGFKGAVSPQDEIATTRAADGPAKIHPETAAATEIPDQDASVLGGSPARPTAASTAKTATPKSAATPRPAVADANGNPRPSRTSVVAKAKRMELTDTRDLVPAAGAPQPSPGSFAVQLAAPGTEQGARETQVRLMQKFAAELAGSHTSIHKAAVGGKPVYRVRVAGFPSRDEANALCQKVQSGGGNCFVAKN
jgi:septal ring-binding cell division protein DamX